MTTGPPRFELPSLPAASDGWGPSGPPASLEGGVPYAPFSKGERIGRIADFTPSAYKHGKRSVCRGERKKVGQEAIDWSLRRRRRRRLERKEHLDRLMSDVASHLVSCFHLSQTHFTSLQQAATIAGTASPLFLSSTWQQTRRYEYLFSSVSTTSPIDALCVGHGGLSSFVLDVFFLFIINW